MTMIVVKSINSNFQKMIYEHNKISQEIKLEKDKIGNKNEEFFQENYGPASRIEQKTTQAIIENKRIEFPKEYYKINYLSQTTKQTKADKKEETEHQLKTIFKYFLEGIKSINEVQNEVKRNLFIEASGANEIMIVDNKLT